MLKVNEFQFYELANAIHPIAEVDKDAKYSDIIFQWMGAKEALQNLFKQRALEFCFGSANDLYLKLKSVVPDNWEEAIGKMHNDTTTAEPKLGFTLFPVKEAAQKFETILNAELSNSDTYWISPKGTHKTSVLMSNARRELPDSVLAVIPENAAKEIDEAGRCMLFDNSTAAGFHLFRATEDVIRTYYAKIVGTQPPKKARNWGAYIKTLNSKGASARVTNFLHHIKEEYRNPVFHPEVSLKTEEAQILFGVCISAISMMALEMKKNTGAALPFPATGTIAAGPTT